MRFYNCWLLQSKSHRAVGKPGTTSLNLPNAQAVGRLARSCVRRQRCSSNLLVDRQGMEEHGLNGI